MMIARISLYVVALMITAGVALTVAVLAWQRRKAPGAVALIWFLVAVAEWAFTAALEAGFTEPALKLTMAKIEYFGTNAAPVFLLVFALQYARKDRWLTWRNLILVSIIPVLSIILAFTNEMHGWVWSSITLLPAQNVLQVGHGFWFWVMVAYYYVVLMTVSVLLIRAVMAARNIFRSQGLLLLAGLPFPWIGNILYAAGFLPGMDLTPIGFTLTGIFLGWDILTLMLFDLVPVAREQVLEWMEDAVVVLDRNERVVDLNPPAMRLLDSFDALPAGLTPGEVIGMPAKQLFQSWPEMLAVLGLPGESRVEINGRHKDGQRVYDLRLSELKQRYEAANGRIITLHDITQLKIAQQDAENARQLAEGLQNTGTALNSTLEFDVILDRILDEVSRVLPYDYATFQLVEENESVVAAVRGFVQPDILIGWRNAVTENSLSGRVVLDCLPIRIENIEGPMEQSFLAIAEDIRSSLAVPVIAQDHVTAVLTLYSRRPGKFLQDDEPIANAFAGQVSIALENSRLYQQMKEIAIYDSLTGIYSRRHFFQQAEVEFERANRYREPLCIIMMDLDHFKRINDTFGHQAGDAALVKIIEACKVTLRKIDIFGRYGGEEFVILLPETSIKGGLQVAERLRGIVEETEIISEQHSIQITASLGVSTIGDGLNTLDTLLSAADRALYSAKENGRNQVGVFGHDQALL